MEAAAESAAPPKGAPVDYVFACAGSFRGAVALPQQCGDPRCNKFQEPLQKVQAVYSCSGSCSNDGASMTRMSAPGRCSIDTCNRRGQLLECQAACPVELQFPLLDPPETRRQYSSVWDNDAIGTGHARSRMTDSPQGWSALRNDPHQWVVMDTATDDARTTSKDNLRMIAGVVISNRRDCREQLVTRVSVDAKGHGNGDDWSEVVHDYATGLTSNDTHTFLRVPFDRPLKARFVRIRPLEWAKHVSLRCALILHRPFAERHIQDSNINGNTTIEYRPVLDLNQLPLRVAVNSVPGGLPAPSGRPPRPFGVVHPPSGRCRWQGRQTEWRVLSYNGKNTNSHILLALPGQRCTIRVGYDAWWDYNQNDYCPGCIVQLYYGMANTFCTGVVQNGISRHRGASTTEFVAPMEPGLYYITQSISLMYNYVDNIGQHHHTHQNAFCAIRVLPTQFTPGIFPILPVAWQRQFLAILAWSNQDGTVFSKLGRGALFHIFSFLLGQEDRSMTIVDVDDGDVQSEDEDDDDTSIADPDDGSGEDEYDSGSDGA